MPLIKNKYRKLYLNIIKNALSSNRQKVKNTDINYIYYECHHIFPKALYPTLSNKKWNNVLLTGKEHFICHKLLTKFTIGRAKWSMDRALFRMSVPGKYTKERYKPTAKHYERIKRDTAESHSKLQNSKEYKESDSYKRHQAGCIKSGNQAVRLKTGVHSESFKLTPEQRERQYTNQQKVMKEKYPNGTMYNKKHSEETKAKMSKSAAGERNSQYGTIWITNEKINKKIKKDQLIPVGFRRGMSRLQ